MRADFVYEKIVDGETYAFPMDSYELNCFKLGEEKGRADQKKADAKTFLMKDCELCLAENRADVIEKMVDNTIESIEEIKAWYEEKYKEISDVQICIILDDLNNLVKELKEQTK